jgi:hypothetical protein
MDNFIVKRQATGEDSRSMQPLVSLSGECEWSVGEIERKLRNGPRVGNLYAMNTVTVEA